MMNVAEEFSVICLDAIDDPLEKSLVRNTLIESGKEIIEITETQTKAFAGNNLEVANNNGKKFIVMSSSAFHSLEKDQITRLEKYGEILHSNLKTIETCGGGSARCMMAEVFLPTVDFSVDKPPELINLPPV